MRLWQGIFLMLVSTLFFSSMNAIIKYLNILGYSSMENVFFRAFFMIVSIYAMLVFYPLLQHLNKNITKPVLKAKKKGGFKAMFLRGLFGGFAVSVAYYNFATIPLGIATAFLQSTPIFVVLFSFFSTRKPPLFTLLATLIGFLGVLFVANPQTSNIGFHNAFLGILGAMSAASAFLTIGSLRQFYSSEAVVLYYGVAMCIVGIIGMNVPLEKVGGFIFPDSLAWFLFILTGITGTLGQWLMTKSYMLAPAAIVSPIAYMRIIWSLFLGIALGDAFPHFLPTLGIILILLSGFLIAFNVFKKEKDIKNKNKA